MDHETAIAILDRHGIKPDHSGALPPLGGANRAQVRNALNFTRNNPPPPKPKKSRKRTKKAEE